LNQLLLLNELDVGERVGSEFDSLVETVLSSVRDIDNLDDLGEESRVEQVTSAQISLELGTTGKDESGDVDPIVGDEVLDGEFGNFSNVISSSFLSETRESKSGLTTSTVLFG
jgi:hypothetical protein